MENQINDETRAQAKVEAKEQLKQLYKSNIGSTVVIGFWIVMIIGNIMGTGINWSEEISGGTAVSVFAYLIAFGLSGMMAGEALAKFILNRKWNSTLDEAINNDTIGGIPLDKLLAEMEAQEKK